MKILKMIGLVVAVHVVVLTFGFALPGCQSSVRTSPAAKPEEQSLSNMSRIDAARARTPVGREGTAATTSGVPATAQQQPAPAQQGSHTFVGGVITDFGAPVPVAGATPSPPASGAESLALPAETDDQAAALTYTVASGDSLWKIANKFKTTTDTLAKANNLSRNATLQIGQKLKIPAKPAIPSSAIAGTLVYKVKANDSLGGIARRYNTTVEHIQSLNNLTGTTIRVNQELAVPASNYAETTPATGAAPLADTTSATKTAGMTIVHTVKPGDSLSAIASYYGVTRNEIAVANHITNPNKLRDGQKLTIPNATKNTGNAALGTAAATSTTATVSSTMTVQPAQQPAASIPTTPIVTPESSPVSASPISPVSDSPVSTSPVTGDAPPVVLPQDPSPIAPQN